MQDDDDDSDDVNDANCDAISKFLYSKGRLYFDWDDVRFVAITTDFGEITSFDDVLV